jgi:hypothetical protein
VSRKISPAMVVALLALFVALGGSTFAATHYRITSTKQIKPNVIRYLKGQPGKRGSQGKPGTQGPAGATSVRFVRGPVVTLPPFQSVPSSVTATAECPAGTALVGGGGRLIPQSTRPAGAAVIAQSYPESDDPQDLDVSNTGVPKTPRRWVVVAVNPGPDNYGVYPSAAALVWAYALCANP